MSGGRLAKYPKSSGQPEDSPSFLSEGSVLGTSSGSSLTRGLGLGSSFVTFSSSLTAGSA